MSQDKCIYFETIRSTKYELVYDLRHSWIGEKLDAKDAKFSDPRVVVRASFVT